METAGIIGLGIMGGAMARNLLAAGWRVVGFDPDRARGVTWRAGVEVLDSAEAVAREAPVLLTSLPSPAALRATASAIAGSGAERRVVVEASTMTLEDKLGFERVLREAGHVALDCPMSGTGAQAKTRDLVIYASGDSGGDRAAQAVLRRVLAGGARPRRLRQRQPDEIRGQPAGRDPQRGHGGGDGARAQGGARPEAGGRAGERRGRAPRGCSSCGRR